MSTFTGKQINSEIKNSSLNQVQGKNAAKFVLAEIDEPVAKIYHVSQSGFQSIVVESKLSQSQHDE